jgi:hypothetical protein
MDITSTSRWLWFWGWLVSFMGLVWSLDSGGGPTWSAMLAATSCVILVDLLTMETDSGSNDE